MLVYMAIVGLTGLYVLIGATDASQKWGGAFLLALAAYHIFDSYLRPSRRSLDEVGEMFREADRIRRTDPGAAQGFVDSYFQQAERRAAQERAPLRARATTEIGAAKQLAGLLHRDLESLRDVKTRLLPKVELGQRAAAEARNDQRQQEIQAELSHLENAIRHLG